jgi:hypothetical protein
MGAELGIVSKATRKLIRKIAGSLPDRAYLFFRFRRQFGYWPDKAAPRTFNERLLWYKLSTRGDPRYVRLVDKIEAKEYAAERIGREHIIPTLWFGEELPSRPKRAWPIPYVIKASHGWAQNHFVRAEQDQNWTEIEEMAARWLRHVHGRATREWPYTEVCPRLLVEPYMGRGNLFPVDYKFYVFNGVVKMVHARTAEHRRAIFDPDWNRLNFEFVYPSDPTQIDAPLTLDKMRNAAEALGRGLPFVRVDLYEIHGRMYFGELTLFPEAGFGRFSPEGADVLVGMMWN